MEKKNKIDLFWKVSAIVFLIWIFLFLFVNRYVYYETGFIRVDRFTSRIFRNDAGRWIDIRKETEDKEREQAERTELWKKLKQLNPDFKVEKRQEQENPSLKDPFKFIEEWSPGPPISITTEEIKKEIARLEKEKQEKAKTKKGR